MNAGRLQHELKKKQPFASLDQEVLLNMLRTNDQLQIRLERLFRQYGLTHFAVQRAADPARRGPTAADYRDRRPHGNVWCPA